MTDSELLEQLRRDRTAGMETLLRQYGPLLRYVVGGVLRHPEDTEDCLSEITLSLWQRLEDFDPARGTLSAWLTAIARNTALNALKARLRREHHLAEPESEPVIQTTPEHELLKRERLEQLRRAVAALPRRDQQLFYRRYYYLQSAAQIAAELGMRPRAVEGRLYRLRQKLREKLGGEIL